ncbi:MAG: hypothetical protein N3A66_02770, partial [Planctomycetota bacterium]|nr:hypothetical protein [Planctomycetota bacterium]
MAREFFHALAREGARFPIGCDLVLHRHPDADAIVKDGKRLGQVVIEAARCFQTPLAIPLMDLKVEKDFLLAPLSIAAEERETFQFSALPPAASRAELLPRLAEAPLTDRLRANVEAIAEVTAVNDLVPCGMVIGPFSLMTKLFKDPITPIYLAGIGITAEESEEVAAIEWGLEVALAVVLRSIREQVQAGARLMVMAEPAVNKVFFSSKQLEEGSDIFDRYAVANLRRIKEVLAGLGVDWFLHDCGELTDKMLQRLAALEPAVLSLGSSRCPWEDARLVSKNTVLYGNLPSKRFIQASPTSAEVKA